MALFWQRNFAFLNLCLFFSKLRLIAKFNTTHLLVMSPSGTKPMGTETLFPSFLLPIFSLLIFSLDRLIMTSLKLFYSVRSFSEVFMYFKNVLALNFAIKCFSKSLLLPFVMLVFAPQTALSCVRKRQTLHVDSQCIFQTLYNVLQQGSRLLKRSLTAL